MINLLILNEVSITVEALHPSVMKGPEGGIMHFQSKDSSTMGGLHFEGLVAISNLL